MRQTPVICLGTLDSDGIIQLSERPNLPAGPVEVVVRSIESGAETNKDWWTLLLRARAEREASGCNFRSRQEIDADLDALRSEWP